MQNTWNNNHWQGKVANHRQAGGIETAVLDNGAQKGVRVAWVNTGTGLFFKVVLDRGMDIYEAFAGGRSIAWMSHVGTTPPDQSAQAGLNWLNYFAGGLLTTCGLTHVGGPESDEHGVRGLHDRIAMLPAEIESVVQPDLLRGRLEMSITGRMVQSTTVLGPHLEMRRTISAKLGEPIIKIHDEVTNIGNTDAPHMILYHINFGFPLIDETTRLVWSGKWTSRAENDVIFNDVNDFRQCKPPIPEHDGSGESAAFIDMDADADGNCRCEVVNDALPLRLIMRFRKDQLPWVTNWQHWGRNEYVTALEPGTHPPIGQAKARQEGSLIFLKPGETRCYDIEMEVG